MSYNATLLIVDDEEGILEVLKDLLSTLTPNILTAPNGKLGLDIAKSTHVDAVISDIAMPVMNGFLFLSEFRQFSLLTPFIIITAFGDRENLLEAIRLNATDLIEKPFEANVVLSTVQKALDFGIKLRDFERILEEDFNKLKIPADEVLKKKQIKRALFGMKYGLDKK